MSEKKWDLHMHSTCSDGSYTPLELVEKVKQAGLTGFSITDHDTLSAYTDDLFAAAKKQELDLIVGVEFSTMEGDIPIHILGYGCTLNHPSLDYLAKAHQRRRRDRNEEILAKLKKHGIDISYEELEKHGTHTIGRPHIAMAMIEKGVIKSVAEAFDHWIGDGGKFYSPGKKFSPGETIEAIHAAQGKAILAHPILLKKKKLIKKLIDQYPFDGIECFYAAFAKHQKEGMVAIAKESDLIITGGSDFHGGAKPYLNVGASYTSEQEVNRLKR